MKPIILIAGHNRAGVWPPHRKDPGAICPFEPTCEHYEAEKIVAQAADILRKQGSQVTVCDFTLDLAGKIKWMNKNYRDAVMIEVHFNSAASSTATGTETWYLSKDSIGAYSAKVAQQTLCSTLGLRDRGIHGDLENRWGRLGILRDTTNKGTELLIEIGFISNRNDLAVCRERGPIAIAKIARELSNHP